ncbi:MAG: hypothetical protein QOJ64_1521 [Acidobacteriota bacterium]|nr:hypothetical protein [Acidobacteriota bacterium]
MDTGLPGTVSALNRFGRRWNRVSVAQWGLLPHFLSSLQGIWPATQCPNPPTLHWSSCYGATGLAGLCNIRISNRLELLASALVVRTDDRQASAGRERSYLRMESRPRINAVLTFSLIIWLFVVVIGMSLLLSYENAPGNGASPPVSWPINSTLKRTPNQPTLLMMIHPQCPCSRASIGELAILMAGVQRLVNATVVFVTPKGIPEGWEKTDLWSSAAIIPGVSVTVDDGGIEAQLFASRTSGQVVLYDANGKLVFSGGITAARGHSGENSGRSAIASMLTGGESYIRETSVFGCPLFGQARSEETKESCHAPNN